MRHGFMLGDSAGMGKSRVIAAYLLDAHLRGHARKLLVSVNQELCAEALAEGFAPLGCVEGTPQYDRRWRLELRSLSAFPRHEPIAFGSGVLFASYAQLSSEQRLQQLVAWLTGGSKPPVLAFDEGHRAKNLYPLRGKFGTPAMSKQGLAVKALQDCDPDSCVLYSSATGASVPANMAWMGRLALWGPELPCRTFRAFYEKQTRSSSELTTIDLMERCARARRRPARRAARDGRPTSGEPLPPPSPLFASPLRPALIVPCTAATHRCRAPLPRAAAARASQGAAHRARDLVRRRREPALVLV